MKLIKLLADLSLGRIIILGLIITAAYYFTYYDDGKAIEAQITEADSTIATESARRKGIEKTMKKEEEMRGNLLQLQRNLEVVKAKIPNEFKDTQMSAILNRASISSGINVVDLSIKSSSSNQQSAPADINTIRPEDLIEEVKFGITLSGSYEQLLKFLDLLTKEDKIIKVKNFSIEKNSTSYDDDLISFKGEVVGFKQSVNLMSQPGVVK